MSRVTRKKCAYDLDPGVKVERDQTLLGISFTAVAPKSVDVFNVYPDGTRGEIQLDVPYDRHREIAKERGNLPVARLII